MKGFICGLLSGAILTSLIGAYAVNSIYENPYPIYVNGEQKQIQGYNVDDYSYFKLRDIADAVGGFDVDFHNDTIQISKDGYVYENSLEFTDEMKIAFQEYAVRIPDFAEQSALDTQAFASEFISGFYGGKVTDNEMWTTFQYDFPEMFWGHPESEVREQYKLLFGRDMPVMTNDYEDRRYIYQDGYYWLPAGNIGELGDEYQGVKEIDNGGIEVTYQQDIPSYNKRFTTVFTLYPADNENGYIIASKIQSQSQLTAEERDIYYNYLTGHSIKSINNLNGETPEYISPGDLLYYVADINYDGIDDLAFTDKDYPNVGLGVFTIQDGVVKELIEPQIPFSAGSEIYTLATYENKYGIFWCRKNSSLPFTFSLVDGFGVGTELLSGVVRWYDEYGQSTDNGIYTINDIDVGSENYVTIYENSIKPVEFYDMEAIRTTAR